MTGSRSGCRTVASPGVASFSIKPSRTPSEFGALSLHEAIAAATLRPARLLGIESERGTLRVGARADFFVFGPDAKVRETWIGGRCVYAVV